MAAKPDRIFMPTYVNTEPFAVTIDLYAVATEADGTNPPIIRAVPLPAVTIQPGETAVLPQTVVGNVLNLCPDATPKGSFQ